MKSLVLGGFSLKHVVIKHKRLKHVVEFIEFLYRLGTKGLSHGKIDEALPSVFSLCHY